MGGAVVYESYFPDGPCARIVRDFTQSLTDSLFAQNLAYAEVSGDDNDHPFLYPERGLYSQVAAAVSGLTPVHLSELSCRRQQRHGRKTKSLAGRSDLWCYYRDTHFIIELKKATVGLGVKADQDHRMVTSWNKLREQIADSRKHYRDWIDARRRVALGLLAILPYSAAKGAEANWPQAGNGQLAATLTEMLGKDLAFFTYSPLPQRLQTIDWDDGDGGTIREFSPFVAVAGTWTLIE